VSHCSAGCIFYRNVTAKCLNREKSVRPLEMQRIRHESGRRFDVRFLDLVAYGLF